MRPVLYAFGFGVLGVAVFMVLDLPLPWLLGPILSCLGAALAGVPLRGIDPLNQAMRTILGVAAGATLTPAVLVTIPSMWTTLVLVPVMILAIALVGVPYFRRLWGYDFPTSYFAAMPGGLQDMIAFGQDAGGNVRALSLIHATRLLVIVVALPFLLKGIWGAELGNPPGAPLTSVPLADLALMIACAAFGYWSASRIGLFGASILGPLILTAVIAMLGILETRPPAEAIWAAQFFIGLTIGSKYAGITMAEVRRDLAAGLGFCLILIVLTVIVVEGIALGGLAPGMEALLAFSPGGQAELVVMALIVGADVAFVVTHHVVRLLVVILGAPVAMAMRKTASRE